MGLLLISAVVPPLQTARSGVDEDIANVLAGFKIMLSPDKHEVVRIVTHYMWCVEGEWNQTHPISRMKYPEYTQACIVTLNGLGPQHMSDMLLYQPPRDLRSSWTRVHIITGVRTKHVNVALSVYVCPNPVDITLYISKLKTFLFTIGSFNNISLLHFCMSCSFN